ncbi:nuclease domain-containing protein [Halomonas sp. NO4]|uniref:nuclease domain-containing protein n=1 Tax=Halomonas sp. NO4 TaxID=2484813 RepID=UPI0013D6FA83|nr:nuclease domain-containing protein [Halomonas sp. NO4]
MYLKPQPIRSKQVRDAARGERCTLQILGVCNHDDSTTVLSHLPDESHGMARKGDDISACFACHACHDVIDGRRDWPEGEAEHREWYMRRAQTRTLRRLIERGIANVKGVA